MSLNRRLFSLFVIILSLHAGWVFGLLAGSSPEAAAQELASHRFTTSDDVIQAPKDQPTTATLFAVGDIMIHQAQLTHAHNSRTNTYDFSDYFSLVQPIFATGDWVFGNLETPVAGPEPHGYTGYPQFNAPTELLDVIKTAGFNVLSTANNHILDRGIPGLHKTLENIHARGILAIGTATSEASAAHIPTITRRGMTLAFLSYTYGINGYDKPPKQAYLVDHMDEPKMLADIQLARGMADIVVVSLHWGREYEREPTKSQRRLAKRLIDAGADVLLGHHAHVVQPFEWIATENHRGVVIYSLGNFISNQTSKFKPYTEYGAIFSVQFRRKSPQHPVEITNVHALPTWVHRPWSETRRQYYVVPLARTLDLRSGPFLKRGHFTKMQQSLEEMDTHLSSFLPKQSKASSK